MCPSKSMLNPRPRVFHFCSPKEGQRVKPYVAGKYLRHGRWLLHFHSFTISHFARFA